MEVSQQTANIQPSTLMWSEKGKNHLQLVYQHLHYLTPLSKMHCAHSGYTHIERAANCTKVGGGKSRVLTLGTSTM